MGDWSVGALVFGELFEWDRFTLGFVGWVLWGFFFSGRERRFVTSIRGLMFPGALFWTKFWNFGNVGAGFLFLG